MKRAPLVITGTLMGLAGVFSFHSSPANLSLGSLSAATPPGSTTTTSAPTTTTTTPPRSGGSTPPATTTTTVTPTTTTTGAPSAARSATGAAVNYNFGILSVGLEDHEGFDRINQRWWQSSLAVHRPERDSVP
jgi:hypothetical protein